MGSLLTEVRISEGHSREPGLKNFRRQCAEAGIIPEDKKQEHFEKPGFRRKKKAEAARKR